MTPGLVSGSVGTYITQVYSQLCPNGQRIRIQQHVQVVGGSIPKIRVRAIFWEKSSLELLFLGFGTASPPQGVRWPRGGRWGVSWGAGSTK